VILGRSSGAQKSPQVSWRERPLRIALTADPGFPVPPRHYGGIERIVDMLAKGLSARGHELTVFAHSDSATAGHLVPWPGGTSRSKVHTALNAATLTRHVMRGHFDVVHSFSRVAYLVPLLPTRIPKLMTYQRAITRRSVRLGHQLSRGTLWFSATSAHMTRHIAHSATVRVISNGVPLAKFHYRPDTEPDAPLVFLGRVENIKGPHLAISVARAAGVPLVIAGNIPPGQQLFFNAEIKPYLDGSRVKYVGPVDDAEKNALLGRARALLMPVLWDEPFGIVMIEAMACGTPVIGFARGAVPEVVTHGTTGFIGNTVEDLVSAVRQLSAIDRMACRARVEHTFSDRVVVDAYENLYLEMLTVAHRHM
jgi:glycosyltransferase involved in cell wall biosynthesis